MRKIISVVLFSFLLICSAQAQQSIAIGAELPGADISVRDVDGRNLTLSGVSESNGLLVIFSCNTCPWVSRWEDRMKNAAVNANANNIGVIVLNPNERTRERGESLDDMKRRSDKQNYNFIYALDQDHKIADALGATETPEVFLFNGDMKLVYKGSIDDNPNRPESVENHYLMDALNALATGEVITRSQSQGQGCSIKRIR